MGDSKKTILVVDDEDINRMLLKKCLENDYNIIEARNGQEAIEVVQKQEQSIAMVLLDLVMPVADGFKVLRFLNEYGFILAMPVIAVTADNTLANERQAFDLGVCDFIAKPFRPEIVKKRVENMIDLFERSNCLMELVEEQTAEVFAAGEQLQQQYEMLQNNNDILIDGLSSVVEFRSIESGEHIKRIKGITEVLLRSFLAEHTTLKVTDADISAVVKASALHDIGKIAIPDNILLKEGKLTAEEFEVMKKHCEYGTDILKKFEGISDKKFLKYAYNICRYHHERIDGKGYPEHLSGNQIPLYVQIVSIADVYDALVSPRIYKKEYTSEQAIKMIIGGECGAFASEILKLLVKERDQLKKLY